MIMTLIQFFGLALLECFVNISIAHGLTMLVLILLRPVTNHLLRPKYRVLGWMGVCLMGWTWSFYSLAGLIHLLPFTFRGWIVPTVDRRDLPAYIPDLGEVGEKVLTLPGGAEIPFVLTETLRDVLAVGMFLSFVLVIWWMGRKEKEVRRLIRETEPMSDQWHEEHGIDSNTVSVRIVEGLPASFVCRMRAGYHDIFLQKELPREQMELVLRHEMQHIKGKHVWFKSILVVLLGFYWWSPVMWITYRLACRDMELACDEAVLNELEENRRRTYARTLVELGSGKPMWGGLTCFGETDAALRVRSAVTWKRERRGTKFVVLPLLALAFLFFFTAPNGTAADRAAAWEQYVAEKLTDDFDAPGAMARSGEILEVRVKYRHNFNYLLLHTDNGRWHLCAIKWHPDDGKYRLSSHRWVDGPEKYDHYIPIDSWG